MEIIVAKTAGFCFGVDRSLKLTNKLVDQGCNVCTLGFIIHNSIVVGDLLRKGVKVIDHPSELPFENTLVIRSHGISKDVFNFIEENNIKYVDATCPFVKKIHKIVDENSKDADVLLAAGNENHPEMIGIRSYFNKKSYIFKNLEDLKNILKNTPNIKNQKVLMVSQTTFSVNEWEKCVEFVKLYLTKIRIFDTICNTTTLRQREAEELSKKCDLMIVIGDKKSSNTKKLYDICKKNTKTIFAESEKNIPKEVLQKAQKIGITAGASTPICLVTKIKKYLESDYYGD